MDARKEQSRVISFILNLVAGRLSKKVYLRYFLVVMLIYAFGMIFGASMYPGGFSLVTVYTSYLGSPVKNPSGALVYNICELSAGIMLIPHFTFLYRRLSPTMKVVSFISCLLGILGSIGFAGIGIFYQDSNADAHQITTIIAFGGYGLCALFMISPLIRNICLKRAWPKLWHFLVVYGQLFGVLTVVLVIFENKDFFMGFGWNPALFEDKFSEWFYVFIAIGWIVEIALIVPKSEA
ncbi:MAG: hypothetical protein ACTSUE_20140 [Promethearchaeota archaeon]